MKFIANTTHALIYAHYKVKGRISTEALKPGLNEVETHVFKALMKESGFQKLLDGNRLSVAEGDLDAATDVTDLADSDVDVTNSVEPPKPEATGNQKNEGAAMGTSMNEAVQQAKDKPVSEAGAPKTVANTTKKTAAKKTAAKKKKNKKSKRKSKK